MPQALTPALEALIARIGVPEPTPYIPAGQDVDELTRLRTWWTSVANGAHPVAATLLSVTDLGTASDAVTAGVHAADSACDSGATLVVPRAATGAPVAALAVIGALTRADAATITYQAPGMADREWMDRCAAVRDACAEVADLRAAPIDLLDALGARDIAFVVGALLAAAARRTPCIVDGVDELAAALVADRLSFRAKEWWRSGSTSPDPARQAAIERLALNPGLPLGLGDSDGQGARATVAMLEMLLDEQADRDLR